MYKWEKHGTLFDMKFLILALAGFVLLMIVNSFLGGTPV